MYKYVKKKLFCLDKKILGQILAII